jgi:MSHA biogenesis protein MshQ
MNATPTTLSDALGRRRRWLAAPLLGLALLASQAAEAQIAFRNAASSSAMPPQFRAAASASIPSNVIPGTATVATGAAVGSVTFSHVTPSGTDRLLVVGVSFDNDGLETVTGITYGGVALTKAGSVANVDDARVEIWYRVAPAVGTANVVVTLSATLLSSRGIVVGALPLTGVHQTTPVGTFQSTTGGLDSASLNVTSSVAGDLVVAVYASEQNSNAGACVQGSGQTEHWDARGGSGSTTALGCGMTETGGGTVTISLTTTDTDVWALGAVPVKPASTALPTGSIAIPVPTGTVQNDVMIASIGVRPSTSGITAPSGWTLVRRIDNASTVSNSLAIYRRVAGASEPGSYTWTLSGDAFSAGGIQSFENIDTANPIDVENGQTTASGTAHATPSVTTTVANAMLVTSHTYSSNRTWTPPSGMTEAFDFALGTDPSTGQAIEGNYVRQSAAGSTGTKTATAAGDADVGNAHILALRPLTPGLTIPKPTGTVAGDFMVAAIGIQDDAATITPPSGWTLVRRIDQATGTDNSLAVYTKAAGASEPASYTWGVSGSTYSHAVGGIQSFSGVDTAAAVNLENGQATASSTSHATPDITPTVANTMLVTAHTFASSRTWTPPTGMTEAYDQASLPVSNSAGQSIEGSYAPHVFLATGTKTATASGNADTGATHILALRPLPATGVAGGFNAYDTGTAAGATSGFVKTKIAGSTVSVAIISLNLPRTAIETTFTGTVRVEVLDASNNTGALDAYGCRSTWTVLQTLSPDPAFIAGDNGRKTVSFTQADSYTDMRLRVSYPTVSPTRIGCSNDNFALRPDALASYSVTDTDWQTAGTTRTLGNTALPGGVTHKAGRPFTVQATAVNGAGTPATTTNYTGAPTPTLTDCGASSACPSTFGTVTLGSSFVLGVLTATTASYSEVGSFNMQLRDTTFSNVDAADGSPADCTASGRYVCSSTLAVGRFVPDNFAVALNTPSFGTACGSFTYVGQKFNYAAAPVITVTARNFAGGTTVNYAGALWQITTASLTGKSYTAASGTLDTSGITGTDPVIASVGSGVGTLTFGSGTGLFFTRSTPVAPFDADISLAINVIDLDLVASATNPAQFGAPTAGNGIAFSSGKPMRFGRLVIRNANGSQLLPLPVRVEAQYWSGAPTNAFITNTLDNCTSIASANDAMGNYTGNLSGSPTCETAISGGGALGMGRRTLLLAAPGSGNTGSVNVTVNLGAAASGSTCTTQGSAPGSATTANFPHLQGNWTGVNYDQNPTARATFGVSRGAEEVIFVRENF